MLNDLFKSVVFKLEWKQYELYVDATYCWTVEFMLLQHYFGCTILLYNNFPFHSGYSALCASSWCLTCWSCKNTTQRWRWQQEKHSTHSCAFIRWVNNIIIYKVVLWSNTELLHLKPTIISCPFRQIDKVSCLCLNVLLLLLGDPAVTLLFWQT